MGCLFRKFTGQGHCWGRQVILHSCGSIYKVVPRLIEAGVACLYPLQERFANLIVSPSHEAILPDVPPENVRALAEAAIEDAQ